MFLFANWKDFAITVADPSGWTPIVNSFADGSASATNGGGSVSVAAWYRDWQSGDGNPSLNWSASPTEAHAVVMLWTKAGGDTWGTPTFRTGAIAAADPFTVDASATVTVSNASVVIGMIALRDDSSTIARATDAIDDTGGLVTWNGNYVESPATHFSSTTGLDMSGDMGHRFVTTGAAGVTLHMDGDPAAAESGTALFVLQALFVSNPITVTPTTASLTTATFAPTVTASDHKTVTPTTASLAITAFAPTVAVSDHQTVTPAVAALTLTTFAPSVSLTDHQLVVPTTAALTLTTFAPTVTVEAGGVTVTPDVASLVLSTFAPTVAVSDHQLVTPPTAELVTATFAPTVAITNHVTVIPTPASLAMTAFAPNVVASDHKLVTPAPASLTLTGFAPNVGQPVEVVPSPASLSLTAFAPTVVLSDNLVVTPTPAILLLTAFAPTVTATGHRTVTPGPASLVLTTFAPTVDNGEAVVPALPDVVLATILGPRAAGAVTSDRRGGAALGDAYTGTIRATTYSGEIE